VIGPGWLPQLPSRRGLVRRTLPYTRGKKRTRPRPKPAAHPRRAGDTELVLFDPGTGELPTATLRPRAPGARATALLEDLKRWLAARWSWLRPRTVPVAVAGLGMWAVLASADYLAHSHGKQIQQATPGNIVYVTVTPR
jgi:hypothetical protein